MKFLVRLVVSAVAIYAAIALLQAFGVSGVTMEARSWLDFIWLALIFAVINAVLKPILKVIGCPILVLTFGLGSLLINTLLFYVLSWAAQQFNIGFSVTSFIGAFLGSLIVSIISVVLNRILRD